MSIDQIYEAVQALPVVERLRLVERVVHSVVEASAPKTAAPGDGSLIGLFADEPDLIDRVERMAFEDRARA